MLISITFILILASEHLTVDSIPLHSGSRVYVPRQKLIKIFSKKPSEYTSRLAELVFGIDLLKKIAKTKNYEDYLDVLDQKKLESVISMFCFCI